MVMMGWDDVMLNGTRRTIELRIVININDVNDEDMNCWCAWRDHVMPLAMIVMQLKTTTTIDSIVS